MALILLLIASWSPPSRAAWIEISPLFPPTGQEPRRRLHGRRGLKSRSMHPGESMVGRRLHGRRGLKWNSTARIVAACCRRLHGRRGLKWCLCLSRLFLHRRRLHGRRGLKFKASKNLSASSSSPPSRAAWIEICTSLIASVKPDVAAFTGGVD